MLRIALAGGIGSGKSFVTHILRDLGAKVVVADEVNAGLLLDPEYIAIISHNFPSVVHNNIIDKKELAAIVYHDEGKRRLLMDLAHPRIYQRMLSAYPRENVVFFEIPLLSESRIKFDQVWYVDADVETRIARIVARDNVSEEYAGNVISLQKGEAVLRDKATCVIQNNGSAAALRKQVKALYCSILRQFS